jgi:hypothetical protein
MKKVHHVPYPDGSHSDRGIASARRSR